MSESKVCPHCKIERPMNYFESYANPGKYNARCHICNRLPVPGQPQVVCGFQVIGSLGRESTPEARHYD